jgi:hypothetical protein
VRIPTGQGRFSTTNPFAGAMLFAMMRPPERDREFIADLKNTCAPCVPEEHGLNRKAPQHRRSQGDQNIVSAVLAMKLKALLEAHPSPSLEDFRHAATEDFGNLKL